MARLSVILPVRNGENYLSQALTCLSNSLDSRDELIVIDDGSEDSTPKILRAFSEKCHFLQVLQGLCRGPAAARNVGLEVAQGKYVSFLDHDDLWPNGRLERHINLLEGDSAICAVVGKTSYEYDDAMSDRAMVFKNGTSALHHVHLGATTFRSDVFRKIGSFNPALRFSEDHEFFLRVREQGLNLYFDDEVSLRYRVHGNNMSLDKSLHDLGVFRILADSIKRRRIQGNINQLPVFGDSNEI